MNEELGIPEINIDDYEIGDTFFPGFYSKLYEATEKESNNKVGIEVFQVNTDYKSFKRFCTISNLGINGIIPIIGYRLPLTEEERRRFYSNRRDILAADYVAVMDFSQLIYISSLNREYLQSNGTENENYNPTIRSKIIYGVAAIMKKLHDKNIIHYDLNIENVFIDENLEPKLKMCKISKYESESNDNYLISEKNHRNYIYYIAPEAYDDIEIDGKSYDVYSYGTLLYQLFTTETVFEGTVQPRTQAIIQRRISEGDRLIRQKSIPDHYWNLINRCWDEEPSKRPSFSQIVEELKSDKFALTEYKMTTDIDELHEYQDSIDNDQISSEKKRLKEEEEKKKKIKEFRGKLKSIDELFFYPRLMQGNGIFNKEDAENIKKLEDGEIGSGGFGVVSKVIYKGKLICQKVICINDDDADKAKKFNDVIREFETIASVHFPTICQIIGMNSHMLAKRNKDDKFITNVLYFEYLENNLKDLIDNNFLSDTLKVRIVVDICHGMKHIHEHNMIHRDLKMENIMLNGAFEAKIVDFGLATVYEKMSSKYSHIQHNQRSMTKGVGTYDYMSPEMKDKKPFDFKTDVYSFGIVLFYIINGEIPNRTTVEVANNLPILDEMYLKNVTSFCKDLIHECIKLNPKDRPSFSEILDELRDNNYMLIENIDTSIIRKRDIQLMLFNQKHNSDFKPNKKKST